MKAYLPIVVIALSFGIYYLYIGPDISELKGLEAKKAEYENVLAKAQELSAKRDEVLAQYNAIPADQIEKLNKIIPTNYDSVAFANDINNLASQYGLTVKSLGGSTGVQESRSVVTDDPTAPPYKTNVVNISVSGNYDAFVKFLGNLESSLRLVDVNSLNIKAVKDAKTSADIYQFVLEVSVYSLN